MGRQESLSYFESIIGCIKICMNRKNLIVQLNDSGMIIDEIADFLDRQNELTKSNNDGSIDQLKWVKFLKTVFAI